MLIMGLRLMFTVIIATFWIERPLSWAISSGLAAALILYGVYVSDALSIMRRALVNRDTVTVVLSFYFITSLQRMLERRNRLKQAGQSLNWLFNNRQTNAPAVPAVIGLLLSTGTMTTYAGIIRSSYRNHLSNEDVICVTSFYRHIPESFLPTYSPVLIALAVSNAGTGEFVLAMLSLVAALFIIGYVLYLRRVPGPTGQKSEGGRKRAAAMLFKSLWSIPLIVMLLIASDIPVYVVTPIAAILNIFVDRLKLREIVPMFRTTFEPVIISNTISVMILKDITTYTGVTHELPVFFEGLSIPLSMVFAFMLFFGTIISGFSTIAPLCMPMTITAMPGAGVPLLVPLMGSACAATQVPSTYVCLFIAAECFKVDIGALVRRNTPMTLVSFVATLTHTVLLGMF